MPKHPLYLENDFLNNDKKNDVLKVDNLDKINKALDTGLSIVDKIIGLKKYREGQTQTTAPAQQSQNKAEKILSKIDIKIDENLAISKLLEYRKNIAPDVLNKKLGKVLEELEKNADFIKPQLTTFIRGVISI